MPSRNPRTSAPEAARAWRQPGRPGASNCRGGRGGRAVAGTSCGLVDRPSGGARRRCGIRATARVSRTRHLRAVSPFFNDMADPVFRAASQFRRRAAPRSRNWPVPAVPAILIPYPGSAQRSPGAQCPHLRNRGTACVIGRRSGRAAGSRAIFERDRHKVLRDGIDAAHEPWARADASFLAKPNGRGNCRPEDIDVAGSSQCRNAPGELARLGGDRRAEPDSRAHSISCLGGCPTLPCCRSERVLLASAHRHQLHQPDQHRAGDVDRAERPDDDAEQHAEREQPCTPSPPMMYRMISTIRVRARRQQRAAQRLVEAEVDHLSVRAGFLPRTSRMRSKTTIVSFSE